MPSAFCFIPYYLYYLMPVYLLTKEIIFPPVCFAEEEGLLAVGGDLSIERLLEAYSLGIFPWYSKGSPVMWWSPDPRLVLFPDELKISRSLRQEIKRETFQITMDTVFDEVIKRCAVIKRRKGEETWITKEMINAYIRLHNEGYAHSVECWHDGKLAGGLYGVSLGGSFFGESMFTEKTNASKVALVSLTGYIKDLGFRIIDCQVKTKHLMSLGAREIPREKFLKILNESLKIPDYNGKWQWKE